MDADAGRVGVAVVGGRREVDGDAGRRERRDQGGGVVGHAAAATLLDHQHPLGATRSVADHHGCELRPRPRMTPGAAARIRRPPLG